MIIKEEILKKLEEISQRQGFIYTLASLLLLNLFLDPSESADINWSDKITFQEFSLLIGLMAKHKMKLDFPTEDQSKKDTEEVYELFQQLHLAHMEPFKEKFQKAFEKDHNQMSDEEKEQEMRDAFGAGDIMLEPMFYSGSGAYDFQYTEFTSKKYLQDEHWILKNKGFPIKLAAQVVTNLKKISEEKARSLFKIRKDQFEDFCKEVLNIFCFSIEDISESLNRDEINSFIKSFSLIPGTVNEQFESIGQYNAFSSHPIIQLDQNLFFLPISFVLTQSLYESPFYWFNNTDYESVATKNRGIATENIAYEMLSAVFGSNIFQNIKVKRNKAKNLTDIDILAFEGNKAVVFQAKSKRLTELSKLGNTEKLKDDFTKAVQDAYEQGLVCREAILSRDSKLIDSEGKEIKLNESIDEVYIVCLTSDEYLALTHQVDVYLTKKAEDPFPVAVSIFDLDMVTFYLKDPFEFLYYLRQRIELSTYFKGASEMALLGYHLHNKLIRNPEYDKIGVNDQFAQLIDANFPVLRGYHPKTDAVNRLYPKWKNKKFEKLIQEVKDTHKPGFTDAIFYLYDLAGEGADELINLIEKTIKNTLRDKNSHDFSLIYDKGKSGITYLSQQGSSETLGPKLMTLAMARKYKTKADTWLALGHTAEDQEKMIHSIGFSKKAWEYDKDLEDLSKIALVRGIALGKDYKKVGRNDPCPCGKLKSDGKPRKFKNCCGK